MNLSVRSVSTALGLGFCAYFVARGLWWTEQPETPQLLIAALAAYLVLMVVAILVDGREVGRMPLWLAVIVTVAAAVIPALASAALSPQMREEGFATWHIGAVGAMCVVCVVKQRPVFGWVGLALLAGSAMGWMGPGNALRLGLVGSIVWMLVAQLIVLLWGRAMRDTEKMADIQRQVTAWNSIERVRRSERRRQIRYALAVASPVLGRVITSGGRLSESERLEARLAEGRLRDELRGASLLSDAVRDAIELARRGGASVTVLDEGGLADIAEGRREEIRAELAEVLATAGALRVIVRSAADPHRAVTIVGRDRCGEHSDEDAVAFWHEIPREKAADDE